MSLLELSYTGVTDSDINNLTRYWLVVVDGGWWMMLVYWCGVTWLECGVRFLEARTDHQHQQHLWQMR
jgi:hypothetical protein